MRFEIENSVTHDGFVDDMIDKDSGNVTVACDVRQEYQRLLQAAPELLQACQVVLDHHRNSREDRIPEYVIDSVEAAIAKAKGEAHE